jgi:hypothetical protein
MTRKESNTKIWLIDFQEVTKIPSSVTFKTLLSQKSIKIKSFCIPEKHLSLPMDQHSSK